MVMPEVVTGQPARNAIWRAMLNPVAPSGLAHPMSTSSTDAGSMAARSMAARTTCPPSVAPCVRLNAPRHDLVSAVRAVETMTASTTAFPLRLAPGLAPGRGFFHGRFARGPGGLRRVAEVAAARRQPGDQLRGFPRVRALACRRGELA